MIYDIFSYDIGHLYISCNTLHIHFIFDITYTRCIPYYMYISYFVLRMHIFIPYYMYISCIHFEQRSQEAAWEYGGDAGAAMARALRRQEKLRQHAAARARAALRQVGTHMISRMIQET
jgi:hypothetical protein